MRDDPLAALRELRPTWRFGRVEALGGGDRSSVYRVQARDENGLDRPYVVKEFLSAGEGWARESAMLTVLSGERCVPELAAASAEPPVLLLADLGNGPNVADALLGDDPAAAHHAVVRWAEAVAAVHLASAGAYDAFEAALARQAGELPIDAATMGASLDDTARRLDAACGSLGVRLPGGALDDLRAIGQRLEGSGPCALTPADTCPDNNVYVGDRLVLIDFEGAQWRHIAWDVAYLRVPWPTCWCSWRIPDDVADAAVAAYVATAPSLVDDAFAADVESAAVAWSLLSTTEFISTALNDDPASRMGDDRAPRRRAMILHRLATAATSTGEPALAELAANLHAALRGRWGEVTLDLAPAFRG